MRTNRKKQKGLSLIEVLISLAILSIGLFAVMDVFPFAYKLNQTNWETSEIMVLAQKKMDLEQAQGKKDITLAPVVEILTKDGPNGDPIEIGSMRTWRTADPEGSANIQIINVEVTYVQQENTSQERVKTYTLTSSVGWPY